MQNTPLSNMIRYHPQYSPAVSSIHTEQRKWAAKHVLHRRRYGHVLSHVMSNYGGTIHRGMPAHLEWLGWISGTDCSNSWGFFTLHELRKAGTCVVFNDPHYTLTSLENTTLENGDLEHRWRHTGDENYWRRWPVVEQLVSCAHTSIAGQGLKMCQINQMSDKPGVG